MLAVNCLPKTGYGDAAKSSLDGLMLSYLNRHTSSVTYPEVAHTFHTLHDLTAWGSGDRSNSSNRGANTDRFCL